MKNLMICPVCHNLMKYHYTSNWSTIPWLDLSDEWYSCNCGVKYYPNKDEDNQWEIPNKYSPTYNQFKAVKFINYWTGQEIPPPTKDNFKSFIGCYLKDAIKNRELNYNNFMEMYCEDCHEYIPSYEDLC